MAGVLTRGKYFVTGLLKANPESQDDGLIRAVVFPVYYGIWVARNGARFEQKDLVGQIYPDRIPLIVFFAGMAAIFEAQKFSSRMTG